MSLNLKHTLSVAFLGFVVLYVEASQAGLVRTTGRSSLSRNDGQFFYYVADSSDLIDLEFSFGDTRKALTDDAYFNNFGSYPSRSPIDENRGVTAVPYDGCIKGFDDAQAAADFDAVSTPCVWEFAEDEVLDLFGSFSMFFDQPPNQAPIGYSVRWDVFKPDGSSLAGSLVKQLSGSLNTTSTTRIANNGEAFTFDTGEGVFLNSTHDLDPGTYNLIASVSLSLPGELFYEEDGDVVVDRACDINFECGWLSVDSFGPRTAPAQFFSAIETLIITEASGDDGEESAVDAPSTLLCSLLGLILLRRRQRAVG
jgi:hypothetical protein